MSRYVLVCPFNETLLSAVSQQRLVVTTTEPSNVVSIAEKVRENNFLQAVWLQRDDTLCDVPIQKEWQGIPVVLHVKTLGAFKEFIQLHPLLSELPIRVYFSTDDADSYVNAKMLASLGIRCGIYFGKGPIDWDQINNLMHYAVYTKTNHASIEPFQHAVKAYDPEKFTDIGHVYFDNPSVYLHIDSDFNCALTRLDLLNGVFVGQGIESIECVEQTEAYKEYIHRYQNHMLQRDQCSFCPGLRLCIGRFAHQCTDNAECKAFFSDFMDACDYVRAAEKKTGSGTWQL